MESEWTGALAPSKRLRYWTPWLALFGIGWAIVFFTAFPQPIDLLRHNWPLFLVGFSGAVIANATSVSGAIVFVPVMLLVYRLPPLPSLQLAMATQSFGLTTGAISWARRGGVPLSSLRVALPGLLIGSTIGTLLVRPDALTVKGLFGPVAIGIGVVMLRLVDRAGQRESVPPQAYLPMFIAALIGGVITGWVAIGAEIVVAFLMLAYDLRADHGVGLGTALLAANSIYLIGLHALLVGGVPWSMAAFTIFGCVYGARLGPYLAQRLDPRRLKLIFGVMLIANGCVFVAQAVFGNIG